MLEPPHEATRSSAGWWVSQEVLEMIALKELKAARHGLHQNLDAIRGRTVKLYQDNMAVVGALRKMSSKCPALMAEIKELVPWLLEHKVRLDVFYIWRMLHRASGASICGPCTCPRSKNSCAWSSQHWARKSAQTLLPAGRARLLQDLPHRCTVVTVQRSTACSSIGLNPLRSGSTRLGIYCLKFWKSFERQEQEVSWSTPSGPFSHGFKMCSGSPLSTSACHLRVSASDRTTQASSSPSSIERCVCGQWSSTVRKG